ncbi:MAG: phosphocarrier protein HPr [Elusimicrobia bacterium RIFOXYA2_FULL_50_26]|nr:MAG: phosphocarrier protein HPr [Elusimicrobia bacterium RIFOXYA2_FULL_50_26]OGS24028.1 MAG: phosphocarrier protein HPr [Elusimicrobia bacterium RIFOXYB2_FULL_50_12]
MQERTALVRNKLGLHARPAALMVQAAARFKSRIKILKDDQEVDGKSIMGLMTLAAAHGANVRIMAEGDDEIDAANAIVALFETGFGEE